MACITPVRAFVGHFSRCWFAHSLKASTIASFDTDDFGHAEGIDLNIKSEGSLMCFNASPFVKLDVLRTTQTPNKKSYQGFLCRSTVCIALEHRTQFSQEQMSELK